MNLFIVTGNVGMLSEPFVDNKNNKTYLSFSLADNYKVRDKSGAEGVFEQHTNWWQVKVYSQTEVEKLLQLMKSDSFKKGSYVKVVGRMFEKEYEAKDGTMKKTTEIKISDVNNHFVVLIGNSNKDNNPSNNSAKNMSDDDIPMDNEVEKF